MQVLDGNSYHVACFAFAYDLIKMLFKDTIQNNKPHIHLFYGEYQASIGIDGELLDRNPAEQAAKNAVGWLVLHKEEAYSRR